MATVKFNEKSEYGQKNLKIPIFLAQNSWATHGFF
jgi:hypothetical protein